MSKSNLSLSRTSVIGIAAAIGGAVFYGVIGNRADVIFVWLASEMGNSMQRNYWPWIIVGVLIIVYIGTFLYSWRQRAILRQTLDRSNKMLALDDSLLRVLASWVPPTSQNDHDEQLRLTLKEILRDATVQFDGHVERAAILLPDSNNIYLKCWTHYQMPQESIDSMRFYIGNDMQRRQDEGGVAGAAFIKGEILVGHMIQQTNGHWICEDQEHYIRFQGTRPFTPYTSFVNVPIIGINTQTNMTTCHGVICFDSKRNDCFDTEELKPLLRSIARRVASSISISEKLP